MQSKLLQGDCRSVMPTLDADSVNCIVTSPPYYGLRDYGCVGQIGMEATPDDYVKQLVAVFREARRALRNDGTLWLNLGDSYNAHPGQRKNTDKAGEKQTTVRGSTAAPSRSIDNLKPKDLIGIPWRVAFALQADGWWLRQDIIWSKPNPMPESVTDRCTKAHEYLFLLSKSERYYFDQDAILEPISDASVLRLQQAGIDYQHVSDRVPGKTNGPMKAVARGGKNAFRGQGHFRDGAGPANREGRDMAEIGAGTTRNKRSVWTVNTTPCKMAHFAVMPEALVEPCVLAGSPVGGTVLDPFGGSGTVGSVAERLGRNSVLIELNPEYVELQKIRTAQTGMAI
jgi:DNA modification methylase